MEDDDPAEAPDGRGLRACYVNCSLKRDRAASHTELLLDASARLLADAGVAVDRIHLAEHPVPPGVYPDLREHGWAEDAWPALWPRVRDADILVTGTPLWLGEPSSLCRVLIERLYGMSGELNDRGQSVFYGRVAGVAITGNEDGAKHAAMSMLYGLQHLGYTIPPQADCAWLGEIGPGPSYGDRTEDGRRAGFDHDFTQRNTTILSWNLVHLARLLKQAGGLPRWGNDRRAWSEGARFGYRPPEGRAFSSP